MHIEDLLREVVTAQASDLHLTSGIKPTMRLWGKLTPMEHYDVLSAEDTFQLGYSMLNTFQKQKFEKFWELDLSYGVPGLGRFRVNIYRQRGAVGIAIRVIPMTIPSVEALNLPPILKELTRKPRGLVLVTGPTGHGKSTSLAAMIDFINTERSAHIVTVEDPIEYLHQHKKSIVNQRELGFDTQSFPNALRAVLREDPNVVLIGEMRDLETISAALTIAETGHLVFATLHTANAAQSIDRIIDVFPPYQQQQIRIQLSMVIEAVISQQLLPNLRYKNRGEISRPAPARGRLGSATGTVWPSLEEVGRVPAVEVMLASPAIRNMIRESKTHQIETAIQTGAQQGMQTMDQSLRDLYLRKLVSLDDALARAIHPEELRKMIREAGGDAGEALARLRA
ncbi:MAG: type IV pilus twitching motility protein PilT [Armatimonadota bacterium]|nr:type IV pilus twitching motility protein PilT [Armatimonadota bacterium]MDR7421765.1 type IV pilus twitching motility protein PilT [Armatimonadota bacterium]MDR7454098.1 type IV pilus twitching motility protein PilT [Armatimonadota bacterium]MDR7496629.1 type IV pilus twitching motility protein PilT [Armatimonadota bacterium]